MIEIKKSSSSGATILKASGQIAGFTDIVNLLDFPIILFSSWYLYIGKYVLNDFIINYYMNLCVEISPPWYHFSCMYVIRLET